MADFSCGGGYSCWEPRSAEVMHRRNVPISNGLNNVSITPSFRSSFGACLVVIVEVRTMGICDPRASACNLRATSRPDTSGSPVSKRTRSGKIILVPAKYCKASAPFWHSTTSCPMSWRRKRTNCRVATSVSTTITNITLTMWINPYKVVKEFF